MFDNIEKRNLVDQLINLIAGIRPNRDRRISLLKWQATQEIQRFDGCDGFYRWVLEEAAQAVTPGRLGVDQSGRLVFESVADSPAEAAETVINLLRAYSDKVDCPAVEQMDELTLAQAAQYLGVDMRTLQHHYYETHKLAGRLIGRTLVFKVSELDRFIEEPRPVGRPPKAR